MWACVYAYVSSFGRNIDWRSVSEVLVDSPALFARLEASQAQVRALSEAPWKNGLRGSRGTAGVRTRGDDLISNSDDLLVETLELMEKGLVSCFLATDLHGQTRRYEKLLASIARERPSALFLGGDLLPHSPFTREYPVSPNDFVLSYLIPSFRKVQESLGKDYPSIFLILGNDDPQCELERFLVGQSLDLWQHIHKRRVQFGTVPIYGYACVPPTPFALKDWERYDVSRYVPPGSVSPEEGYRSTPVDANEIKWGTIQKDLALLTNKDAPDHAVFLFHTPPYYTALDRAALDGKTYEHVALDLHVGSIAVKRFIEALQPYLTLHGHVHEAARLTGQWKIKIGRTVCLNAAHDGPELALVRFDLESPWEATRELL